MLEQLSLVGLEANPSPTDRLFFAIFPELSAAEKVAQLTHDLSSQHGLTARPNSTDRLHITLDHLGDYHGLPSGVVEAASEAAAKIEQSAFEVVFDQAGSFAGGKGNNPFVLLGDNDTTALHDFRSILTNALRAAGVPSRSGKHFTPHITLLRDARLVSEHPIDPVRWIVREFVLVHSLLGQGKHDPLARWPLRD